MSASYPTSVKTFTSRSAGQVIASATTNDLQDEVNAIESGLLNGFTHAVKITGATPSVDLSGAGAGQIKFPSAQNASADANTLDDYEEGTWTPSFGGTGGQVGQAYTTQAGFYLKIGKLVIASYSVTLSTLGTLTGTVQLQGLPFTVENLSNYSPVSAMFWSSMTSTFVNMIAIGIPNTTTATVAGATVAVVTLAARVQADFSATSNLTGTLIYRASA